MSDAPIPSTADLLYQDRQNFDMPQFQLQQTPQIQAQFAPPAQSPVFNLPQTTWAPVAPQFQPAAFVPAPPQAGSWYQQPPFTGSFPSGLVPPASHSPGFDMWSPSPEGIPGTNPDTGNPVLFADPFASIVDPDQSVVAPGADNAMTNFQLPPLPTLDSVDGDYARNYVPPAGQTQVGDSIASIDTGAEAGALRADGTVTPRTLADVARGGPATSDAFRLDSTHVGSDIESMIDYRLDPARREIQKLQSEIKTTKDASGDTSGLEAQLELSLERLETAKQSNLYDIADALNGLADAAGVDPGFLTEGGKVSPNKIRELGSTIKGGLRAHPNADYSDALGDFDQGIAKLASGLREGSAAQVRGGEQLIRTFQQSVRAKTAEAVLDPAVSRQEILTDGSVPARYEGDRAMINHSLQQEGADAHKKAADTLTTEFGFPENDRTVRNLRNTAAVLETRAGVAKGREKYVVNQSDLGKHIPDSIFPPGADAAAIMDRLSDDPQVTLLTQGLHADLGNPDIDPDEAFARYQVSVGRRAETVGKSTTTQGFWGSRNLWGETTQNWGNIMGAGGLALALFGPFERQYEARRAEKRFDKQWEKEKEWQREQMALTHGYRLEQIGARGAADSSSSAKEAPGALKA